MRVRFVDNNVDKFLFSLQQTAFAKITRTMDLLAELGYQLRMPYSKPLGGGLFELRSHNDQSVRLTYTFHNDEAVILTGFLKKTQKTPKQEIEKARQKVKLLASI